MTDVPWPEDLSPKLPNLKDAAKAEKLDKLTSCLRLSRKTIDKIRDVFEDEMKLGLAKNPQKTSSLQMENTFIPQLPNGSEVGKFLALDLGGTNFRIILLELQGSNSSPICLTKHYTVPEVTRLGPGEKLFDFLADCIYDFTVENNLLGQRIPLGFTFSFPMTQRGLDVGILVSWTKSFNCPGVVGQDAVKMLNDALHKNKKLNVDVVAILNDTTGTLVQGAFIDSHCAIGMILGTGSNACYIEDVARVEKWEGEHLGVEKVIVDVEWGAFGDNGVLDFIKTDYDRQVDATSLLVNSFTFEKYFAGKYLGELVRYILVRLAEEGVIFNGKTSDALLKSNSILTSDVSNIESDFNESESVNTRNVLEAIGVEYSEEDVEVVRFVCAIVTVRAAVLVATCLGSLLDRMKREETTIAIDGSLYKHHPRLHDLLTTFIGRLTPKRKFKLILAEDGSGKGAGLVAAVAVRLANGTTLK